MRVTQNPRSPMTRGHVRYGYVSMAIAAPPVQLDDIAKSEVRNQIEHMLGYHYGWGGAAPAFGVLHERAQRWPMKMIEMRVRDQHHINGR